MTPRNSTPHHADETHQSSKNENVRDERGRTDDHPDRIAWANLSSDQADERQSRQQNN